MKQRSEIFTVLIHKIDRVLDEISDDLTEKERVDFTCFAEKTMSIF